MLRGTLRPGTGMAGPAFFWSGVMQRESRVKETVHEGWGRTWRTIRCWGRTPILAFCALWSVIPWQRELVFRVACQFGCTHVLRVWCVSDGTVAGAREPGLSKGWVQQLLVGKDMGGWSWKKRVEDCYWSRSIGVREDPVAGRGGRVAGDDVQVR